MPNSVWNTAGAGSADAFIVHITDRRKGEIRFILVKTASKYPCSCLLHQYFHISFAGHRTEATACDRRFFRL